MASTAQLQSQYRYDKKNTKQIMLKLNLTTDSDVIMKLANVENRQGYIKELVREDLRGVGKVLSIHDIECLVQPVAKRYGVKSVHVFGSYARGEAGVDSDVDLLIDGGNYKGLFEYAQVVEGFEKSLGKHVDVVTRASLDKPRTRSAASFRENVMKDMVTVYESK